MMAEARKGSPKANRSTALHKAISTKTILYHQIWKRSPVVKIVPDAMKGEAVRRMKNRPVTGERVTDIAADLNLSISCLYKWWINAK